ncbi:MAG: patatin-like phospholipase family protein [Neisseriaceae bacterium]|nr:patatin-like phospholipase family protein [Neisseriaceae bacterium]
MNNLKKNLSALMLIIALTACSSTKTPVISPENQATESSIQTAPKQQKRVAVALGGGASKGFAHIGVLKVLKDANIPVHMVTGTSAGAVVGSLYASGMSPDELISESEHLAKSDVADFRLSTKGLIVGQKLQDYINQKVGDKPIQHFPIPFAAVATDFENGQAVAFNHGNTGQAVRASSSIPTIFRPVEIDGRRYADGGLSQPVPVSAARKMGADIVIAVDISARPQEHTKKGLIASLGQSVRIMTLHALNEELSKADVVIKPDVLSLGSTGGFEHKEAAIRAGEQAAKAALPKIRALLGQSVGNEQ